MTNEALRWYNKNIGEPLVRTGNPIAKVADGLGNVAIQTAGGMGQFNVYDIGKAGYTLCTNHEARAQFKTGLKNYWNKLRSGDAYTIGQTAGMVASVLVNPGDISAAAGKASKAESLLGKVGIFSKSVVVSDAENANSVLTKVKGKLRDVGTASGAFAKAFGKTYVKECSKYANTLFGGLGAPQAGLEAAYKGAVAGGKKAKSVLDFAKKVREAGFKYEHNPSDNPKVFKDAVEDSNAVYGYRPSETGSVKAFADDDWSDANLVKYYREKRIEYHKENDANIELTNTMRSQGKTDEEIARAMVERRNQNRLASYIDEDGGIIDQKKYNQALEHCKSYEYLRDKKGKSDLEIIESSIKGNAGFDACTGLYDDYYHTYKIDK